MPHFSTVSDCSLRGEATLSSFSAGREGENVENNQVCEGEGSAAHPGSQESSHLSSGSHCIKKIVRATHDHLFTMQNFDFNLLNHLANLDTSAENQ